MGTTAATTAELTDQAGQLVRLEKYFELGRTRRLSGDRSLAELADGRGREETSETSQSKQRNL